MTREVKGKRETEKGEIMVKFNEDSLLWAKKSLMKQGDSDLFPTPFEIEAINDKWEFVRNKLLEKDMILNGRDLEVNTKYHWVGGRRAIAPKGRLSFRVATQLDPIDSVVLTSLIHQYGQKLENTRIPITKNKVFSYRFKPDTDGHLYDQNNSWINFWKFSLEYAQNLPDGYILVADISDFYNQVYHHTVENELDRASIPPEIKKLIIELLSKLTDRVSRGIPVGPHPSHLLSEISLNPIDHLLELNTYHHCRYSDDIHIFCKNEIQAQIALYDLVNYLDNNGRLVLQKSKTSIMPSKDFCKYAEEKIEDITTSDLEGEILRIIDKYSFGDRYAKIRYNTLSLQERALFTEENLEKIFVKYVDDKDPNFKRLRWLLRRLAQVGPPEGIPFLITNLKDLMPALEDICTYIISTENTYSGRWEELGDELILDLELPIVNHSEYLQMTLISLFSKISDLNHIDKLLSMYDKSSPTVRRKIVNAATKAHENYW